jgi:hypothetical protein
MAQTNALHGSVLVTRTTVFLAAEKSAAKESEARHFSTT